MYRRLISFIDPERLVFLDESGSHIGMTRDYARAPRGKRAHGRAKRNRGAATTMIGALALDGLRTMMTIEGPTTADVFEAFVDHMLIPELKEGDVVVLDNVGAHKPKRIAEKIRAAGAHVLFLPPYSPDLNPIEPCWGKLKGTLKSISATTRRALDDAIAHGMSLITPQDAAAWFHHCGYGGQPT
ncbi:MAG: IS630 family transposase [Myxococcaceae bacterium]